MRLVPSESPVTAAPIVDFFILSIFKGISNHYCCVSGYDKDTGSFCSEPYRDVILAISGVDFYNNNTVSPEQSLAIYCAISNVIADVKSKKWLRHYFHKYPDSKHNFPIDIRNHMTEPVTGPANEHSTELSISSCELEFMQTLFKAYSDYELYLLPQPLDS